MLIRTANNDRGVQMGEWQAIRHRRHGAWVWSLRFRGALCEAGMSTQEARRYLERQRQAWIMALAMNDRNGIYTDEDSALEEMPRLTLAGAMELAKRQGLLESDAEE